MTVHGAKGLEFTHAFLVGAEENVFPSFRSMEAGEMSMEEERRLFYVAMTRAMKKLYITFAQGRMLFGQLKFNGPSRFIDEIPEKLFSWKRLAGEKNNFSQGYNHNLEDDQNEKSYFSQETKYSDEEVVYQVRESFAPSKFPKGSKVQHSLYGKGVVVETEGSGSEEKVMIKFSDGNRKKFMVKFAPLSMV
jgi:DNA helicase-2/ATP-dependent DNA helicase PcrA